MASVTASNDDLKGHVETVEEDRGVRLRRGKC